MLNSLWLELCTEVESLNTELKYGVFPENASIVRSAVILKLKEALAIAERVEADMGSKHYLPDGMQCLCETRNPKE